MINPAKIIEIERHAQTSAASSTHVKSAFRGGYGPSQTQIDSDSFVKYGEITKSRKRTVQDETHNNIHPLIPRVQSNIQNPKNLVQEVQYERWTRGGFPSRSVKKITVNNIPLPQSEC